MGSIAYIPGNEREVSFPLARFLPSIPAGIGADFLAEHVPGCQWVLDPFGVAPLLDVELAQSGSNVLVAVNNPISRFLLELASAPPTTAELQAALSELASVRKGEERLETYLQSLYRTTCRKCQRVIFAEAYVWEKGAQVPTGCIYQCPCGEAGEFAVNEEDLGLYGRIIATDAIHRARALEQVTSPGDPDRVHAELALACYQPRAIHALITTINKLDSILSSLSTEIKRALLALLLVGCDETNSLWSHPADRPRPKQLSLATRFLEKNLWVSLEKAVQKWEIASPVQLAEWQDKSYLPVHPQATEAKGSIYVFDGPARDIVPALKVIQPGAVVTALPRPNQAFWTLSALWTGWLWGREAASSFKPVLRRRRYDWNWHTEALQAALKPIATNLPLNTPIFSILTEPEPGFLTASLVAAAEAGFDLEGIAIRDRGEPVQLTWRRKAFPQEENKLEEIDLQVMRDALQDYLASRGEPASYLIIHAACLSALEANHFLHRVDETTAYLHGKIQASLAEPVFRHHSNSPNVETGFWSLAQGEPMDTLSDRIEIELVRMLKNNPGIPSRDLENSLNATFPGLFTPSKELIREVLASYAMEMDGTWTLRQEDSAPARMTEMETIFHSLENLASRLGFFPRVEEKKQNILHWLDGNQVVYHFYILSSAVTGRLLHTPRQPEGQSILVIPADRTSLLTYKLAHDPGLQVCAESWRVATFENLKALTMQPGLNKENWGKHLAGNFLETPEQMKLF